VEINMLAINMQAAAMIATDVLAANPQAALHGVGHIVLVVVAAIVALVIIGLSKLRN
jgi:hypothetical protein